VRLIARTHGGDVNVLSSEAEGTVFTIRLPRTPQHGAQAGELAVI
jgi:two-component system, sensor histidine kinase and response regulator